MFKKLLTSTPPRVDFSTLFVLHRVRRAIPERNYADWRAGLVRAIAGRHRIT